MNLKKLLFLLLLSSVVACQSKNVKKSDESVTSMEAAASTSVTEQSASVVAKNEKPSPKRIILFLGDGMGSGAVTAAAYAKGKPLQMMQMPHFSWMGNHEYEFITTDSAASATAFSSGHKTHFEALGVKPGTTDATDDDPSTHLRSVLRAAEEAGMRTGLVATSRINHATPAAFASNRFVRNRYDEIAVDESLSGVDVLLGAGSKYFSADGRADKRDLLGEMKKKGYTIAMTADEVRKAADSATQVVGLMHEKDMPYVLDKAKGKERAMSLKEMTETAIKILDRDNDKGWFLMVEGSQIDWCEHALLGRCVIAETLDFDDAVGVGRDYVKKHDDALMVVTADHETAGVSVMQPSIYEKYAQILGGMKQAEELAAPNPASKEEDAELLPAIAAIGDVTAAYAPDKVPAKNAYGLQDLLDARFTVSFGYLSVASRHLYTNSKKEFSGAHTTTLVPLWSEGRGAEKISEVLDNADLGQAFVDFVDKSKVEFDAPQPSHKAKNVILLIGDGMGINSVSADYYGHGNVAMLTAPVKGIVSTNGTDFVVNDSAATATALATGKRTRRGSLGVVYQPGSTTPVPVETILEHAEAQGVRTGLVTTTPLTHATPAAFYAHVPSRKMNKEIADDFLSLSTRIKGSDGIDVAIAGGSEDFDGENANKLKALGYNYLTQWTDGPLPNKTVMLLSPKGMDSAHLRSQKKEPSLAQMTNAALGVLEKSPDGKSDNDKGFFLMVEGGQIDWRLHELNNTPEVVEEINDFDQAVRAALEFAKKDGNTLVIVTADHDHTMSIVDNHYAFKGDKAGCAAAQNCGGTFPMVDVPVAKSGILHMEGFSDQSVRGDFPYPAFHIQYDWVVTMAKQKDPSIEGPHSANFVPLFGWGPSSENFEGYRAQPTVGDLLRSSATWGK